MRGAGDACCLYGPRAVFDVEEDYRFNLKSARAQQTTENEGLIKIPNTLTDRTKRKITGCVCT